MRVRLGAGKTDFVCLSCCLASQSTELLMLGRCRSNVQYSQRDVYILRAHARKKKGLSSTQNPRKTLAHSSQNPRLFHAMSTFIPRKKRVSCVRYKQFHACSRFPRSLRKRSVERIKRHARKGLSFRLVQKDEIVKVL